MTDVAHHIVLNVVKYVEFGIVLINKECTNRRSQQQQIKT